MSLTRMIFTTLVLLVSSIQNIHALNNGLGLVPQMGMTMMNDVERILRNFYFLFFRIKGWNSWNHFACNINEKLIQQTADTLIATGLAAAGYEYGWFFDFQFS